MENAIARTFIIGFCPLKEPCAIGKTGLCTRHECEIPAKCNECGWKGLSKDSIHTYHDDGSGEGVEACEECPKCGSEDVEWDI